MKKKKKKRVDRIRVQAWVRPGGDDQYRITLPWYFATKVLGVSKGDLVKFDQIPGGVVTIEKVEKVKKKK